MRLLLGLLTSLALAAPASADPPGPLSEPIYDKSVTEEFRVDTKHGSIYGWVTRPIVPDGVKVPVILTYSPYPALQSQMPGEDAYGHAQFFVPRGYARAFVHLVGTGNSGGCYDYGGVRERETGHDVVEWLGTRPWSNGRVGMVGVSYDGTTQWAAAVEGPPHLAAIVPQAAITRWYDYAFQQGVRLFAGFGTPLLFDFGLSQIPIPATEPGTAQAFADNARPCEEVEHNQRGFLPDPVYDEFWLERDYLARAQRIKAAVLIEHSWRDYNVHPINSLQIWPVLPKTTRLVVGQDGHSDADFENTLEIRHAFFDEHLLGRPSVLGGTPRVLSEVPDGEIYGSQEWPPRGTEVRRFALAGSPGPQQLGFDGEESPEWSDTDPLLAEADAINGDAPEQTVLFISDRLTEDVRIAGIPVLDATIKTRQQETFLTPVLFAEKAGGGRSFFTRATLNSRNRDSEAVSEPFPPGTTWRGRARFQPVDIVLEAGSRFGLAVMSMNADEVLYPDTTRATNELDLGRSILELPVAPKVEAPLPPPAQPVASPPRRRALAQIVSVRRRGRSVTLRVRCLATQRCRLTASARGGRAVRATARPGRRVTLRLRGSRRVTVRVRAGRRSATLTRRLR